VGVPLNPPEKIYKRCIPIAWKLIKKSSKSHSYSN
jgi:hypothetical protein